MPSKPRPVHLPPKDFGSRTISVAAQKAGTWYRVFPGAFNPIYFSKNDANRFSPSAGPCGALYVAADPETCLMETYGDRIYGFKQRNEQVALPDSDWKSRHVALLTVPALPICDLTNPKTLQECGVDATALVYPELAVPQAWAVAIMQHPANFAGIRYLSRFTHAPCLAIFDRVPNVGVRRSLGSLPTIAAADRILEQFNIALV